MSQETQMLVILGGMAVYIAMVWIVVRLISLRRKKRIRGDASCRCLLEAKRRRAQGKYR